MEIAGDNPVNTYVNTQDSGNILTHSKHN